jgi:hypothetical protein
LIQLFGRVSLAMSNVCMNINEVTLVAFRFQETAGYLFVVLAFDRTGFPGPDISPTLLF